MRALHTLHPDDERHGTRNGYDHWGCRCPACREAKYEYVYNEGNGPYRVERFAGYEIGDGGRRGQRRVDWHVVDERGRTQAIFAGGANAQRRACTRSRQLNGEAA